MSQLDNLKNLIDPEELASDAILNTYLESAKNIILLRRYPFGDFPVDDTLVTILPEKYNDLQVRIGLYLFNKRGVEGQTSHSENGISRGYEASDVPESMLREVIPVVGGF